MAMGPKIVMENCTGCGACMEACARTQFGSEDVSLSMIRVAEVDGARQMTACTLCGACAEVCPVEAIRPDPRGVIIVDEDTCIGCGACSGACPFDLIRMTAAGKARKCMRCAACVMACPNGVFQPPE